MIERQALLKDLQALLARLEADLLQRSESAEVPDVGRTLRTEYARAKQAERTAANYEDWRSDAITQAAAAWVLSCVFVRFLEDNHLIEPPKISGRTSVVSGQGENRLQRARDEHELFFRAHPKLTDRDYLLAVFDELAVMPGTHEVFGEHNPIRELPNWLSGDAGGELLRFFQKIDANTGALVHDFTDPAWDTRFLGDLYQDLSEAARKKYALLQTPEFVEEFILERTLEPALNEFGLVIGHSSSVTGPEANDKGPMTNDVFRMIDPACGSGHFLLGSFRRILERWRKEEPTAKPRDLIQRTLDSIHGVDVNPYAVAIARFRLLLMAMQAEGIKRLADAPGYRIHLAVGDSLMHGRPGGDQLSLGWRDVDHVYHAEDRSALQQLLAPGRYHAVVANPPYITPKDRALNEEYRRRYPKVCHMKYSLAVPFMQRLFDLACVGGFTGQITANSFMKREFGKKLIEQFLPTVDLTHVIDTSGAYIPGHGTPTVILFGRNQKPAAGTIRAVMGIRGEPSTPGDPAQGLVWSAILVQIDQPGSQSDFVSVGDSPREAFHKHPWSIGGGGAAELKEQLDDGAKQTLQAAIESIGFLAITGEDDVFVLPPSHVRRHCLPARPFCSGDVIRDWEIRPTEMALFPYDHADDSLTAVSPTSAPRLVRYLWPHRVFVAARNMFGKTIEQHGFHWFEYIQFIRERASASQLVVFAFVATHNHFVLDRGGKVFNRSAPVIKLLSEATEDDHLLLLGILNSSTACFWMKQVFYPKATSAGDISVEKGKPEANRYEFAGTGLERFPLPFALSSKDADAVLRIARQLDTATRQLEAALPEVILREWSEADFSGLRIALRRGQEQHLAIRERMIALQEELDWEVYRAYGLCPDGASQTVLNDNALGVPAVARPFMWPNAAAPDVVPPAWRLTYESRAALRRSTNQLALIEDVVFKRPWWGRQGVYGRLARDYEGWTSEALAKWLLSRLETYFDFDGRVNDAGKSAAKLDIALTTASRLADVARQDAAFMQVGEVYRDDRAFSVDRLVTELVDPESVPLLPVLRYKPGGLRKRAEWEQTWELQREEDRTGNRLDIPIPAKYTSADFLKSNYWRLRGKLDVPKERWVSFPHCEGPDGTLVIAWAGYDHLQLARSISAYYVDIQERLGGRDDPRLVPLLACLLELIPWLKQWHNEVDAEFGERMGDYFEGFVHEEARQLGKTIPEIKAWEPPKKAGGRKKK